MKFVICSILFSLLVFSCQSGSGNKNTLTDTVKDSLQMDSLYGAHKVNNKGAGMIDSLLPFFAKLHDSIPDAKKFDTIYRKSIAIHRQEREVELYLFGQAKDGRCYFILTRLEPSMKKDKYSGLCASYRKLPDGAPDTSSYRELFWTWKLRKAELYPKLREMFKDVLEVKSLKKYYPQFSKGEYIMFPDERVIYDTLNKRWTGGLELPKH